MSEEKILEAALKVFADKGYEGAKIKYIAAESGYNEITIYRNFNTKENLFKNVLKRSLEESSIKFNSIFMNDETDPQKFLRRLMYDVKSITEENFEFIQILFIESKITDEFGVKFKFIQSLINFLKEKNIFNKNIDLNAFVFTIVSFIYFIVLNERKNNIVVEEGSIEGFIKNSFEGL